MFVLEPDDDADEPRELEIDGFRLRSVPHRRARSTTRAPVGRGFLAAEAVGTDHSRASSKSAGMSADRFGAPFA